ncbi:MAG: major capsid family protein [Cyanobacteria bacterium P01_E01_bin.42]
MTTGFRTDAAKAGTFLTRQLEQLLPKLYEKKYPNLWAAKGEYLPATGDLEEGAETVVAEVLSSVGEAKILSPDSDDIPMVQVGLEEDKFKAFCIVIGFQYSVPELKKAAKAGRLIRTTRMNASNRAMQEKVHKLAVFGSAKHGASGFFNNPHVPVIDSTYNAADPATTAQDHIDFISDVITSVQSGSNLTEGIATIGVPIKLHNIWRKALIPGTSDTVLDHVLDTFGDPRTNGTLRQIVPLNETQSSLLEKHGVHAQGTDKDRLIFAPADPEAISRKFYPAIYMEPQLQLLNWTTIGYCGTTETICEYPLSMRYVDIPKVL